MLLMIFSLMMIHQSHAVVEILELTPISLQIECTNCDQDLYTKDPNKDVQQPQVIQSQLYQDFYSKKIPPADYQNKASSKPPKLNHLLNPVQNHQIKNIPVYKPKSSSYSHLRHNSATKDEKIFVKHRPGTHVLDPVMQVSPSKLRFK